MADTQAGGANAKSMTIICTKGTMDWGYPPFILATTAAAMDVNVTMFFTFYGLALLKKDLTKLKIDPMGKPDMEMPMMGMHMSMPNWIAAFPGVASASTSMMKNMMKKKGVATLTDLREAAQLSDVRMIGCQMTLDLFEMEEKDMIEGIEIGGAATWMESAAQSEINLYI